PAQWPRWLRKNVAAWRHLTDPERGALLNIIRVLVAEKDWEGCGGLTMTDQIKVTIAAQAGLLLLGITHDYYPNVHTILVYPNAYRLPQSDGRPGEPMHRPVLGHASMRGPVVLSWRSAKAGGLAAKDGRNLVFHEFAHKLDMLDGVVDGTPPLLRRQQRAWFAVMTREFEALRKQRRKTVIDLYGATNVAEFFAVIVESFFEQPDRLARAHAELYAVLLDVFGQDTRAILARRARTD
ncbi:MAG: Mlc titration factor MtfA (ptsG expression regulator), partial [Bradymonadia bacterium]